MVSPYLMRPVRTLEQAVIDCLRTRGRSKATLTALIASNRRDALIAGSQVHRLPAFAANCRLLPRPSRDREAA